MSLALGNLGKDDRERAVLPTIMYASQNYGGLRGYAISVGWWKWGIRYIKVKLIKQGVL